MPPPPIPFFRGRTISVSEKGGLLVLRPLGGNTFTSPPGTRELYLPTVTMISVVVQPTDEPGQAALWFHGDFTRVNRPDEVELAPIDSDDAHALAAAVSARFGLPRVPKLIHPDELAGRDDNALEQGAYVTVVGTQSERQFEQADFHGCMLGGAAKHLDGRIAGKRYQVTGFYEPPRPKHARILGYRGARLHVTAISPAPDDPPGSA